MHQSAKKSSSVDMLNGPLYGKILIFALPLIASGILQQSFNAVNVAIIGHYSTSQAIAAVGSNGPIISIMVNLFLGIAVGANVVIANYLGQRNHRAVRESISTVAVISLISGALLLLLGLLLARPILEMMNAPDDVIDLASTYLRIYFCGMPFMMIYNFGSAILRSIGDTKMPFYSLVIATISNLFLDWLFVAVFDMGVDGVAWATVIANGINAAIIILILTREPAPITLTFNSWKISTPDFKKMLQIGVPAGLQGMVFSISNIFIQSAVNSYGAQAIAGSAAALTFEAYCYYIIVSFCASVTAFVGQNYGAGKLDRCKKIFRICMTYAVVICALANIIIILNEDSFIGIFSRDPQVMYYAKIRFHYILLLQCLASSYEVSGAYMRALGYSVLPMVLTIFGTCILRLAWIYTVAAHTRSFEVLLSIYPITWIITGILIVTAALRLQHKLFKLKTQPATM